MPIGKFVGVAGLNSALWAIVISLVPGLILLAFGGFGPQRMFGFGMISGLAAYVIPNITVFSAISEVGAGYVGLMFALSPVFTAILSLLFKVRPPDRLLLISVCFGFAGALLIVAFRGQLKLGADGPWPLIAFIIPVSLAIGNVYRTARWPVGATPVQVGAAANLGAIPFLVVALASTAEAGTFSAVLAHPWLVLTQIGVSLAMFLVFFRLQQVGGPTYLSQLGYVAAAVGLAIGTLFLGESYPWPVWVGAGFIAAGLLIPLMRR